MTILSRSHRVLAIFTLLATVTACTNTLDTMSPEQSHQTTPGQPDSMTPEQSRQVLIAEARTVIQTIFPRATPEVLVENKDVPCGGPVGTNRSSVESGVNVHSDATDKTITSDTVFQQVIVVLKKQGWTINYTQDNVAGAERKGTGGIRVGVSDSPVGINISGTTECVKNPAERTS